MLKPTLVLATAAALAVTVPLASAPAATSNTFALTARLDPHSVSKRPKGAGDVFVFSASLTRDGKPDGRAEFVQTLVDPRYRGISIRGDLLLRNGTLELQGAGLSRRPPGGAKPSANADLAITGGTGAYTNARGTVHLVQIGRTSQRLDISLSS